MKKCQAEKKRRKKDQNIKKQYATYTELKLLISIKEFQLSQIEGARVRVAMDGGVFSP